MTTRPIAPPPLDMTNAFAHRTMSERVPRILRVVLETNPDYPPAIQRAVERLRQDLLDDAPIPPLSAEPVPPPDYADWTDLHREHQARIQPLTWQHTEWYFAEMFVYRLLSDAVRWAETGRDPFAPQKQAELDGDRLWAALDSVLAADVPEADRLCFLLAAALWGNRADLSHKAGDLAGQSVSDDDLLVDDRRVLVEYLQAAPAEPDRPVHLVLDNAGLELASDLALVDALLAMGNRVVIHAKPYPMFVSDATISDVWRTLDALDRGEDRERALVQRLRQAWADGRLRLVAPLVWASGRFLWDMPPAFRETLSRARAVLVKGDRNYRQLTGDAIWDGAVSFAEAVSYFPAPLVVLRTLKSDGLVGVDPDRVRTLDAQEDDWRVSGQYGVIQAAGFPAP